MALAASHPLCGLWADARGAARTVSARCTHCDERRGRTHSQEHMDAFTAQLLCCIAAEFARLPYFSPYGPPELIGHRNIANGVLLRYPPLPPPHPPNAQRGRVTDDKQLTASAWFWFVAVGAPVATSLGGVAAVWRMKRRRDQLRLRAEVTVVEHAHEDTPPGGDSCSGYIGEGDDHELTIYSTKPPSTPVVDYVNIPPSVLAHTPKSPGSRRRVAPLVLAERESPAPNAAPRE